MAGLIKPTGMEDKDSLPMTTGWHVVQCTEVSDLPPSDRWANSKPRILFVFREYDPVYNTLSPDKAVYICTASVFAGGIDRKPSNLVQWARQVGYKNPENGVNVAFWQGRFFAAYVLNTGKAAYVQLHSPVSEPQGETPEDRSAWVQLSIESSPHYGREPKDEVGFGNSLPF
jgi:hypothetical protein